MNRLLYAICLMFVVLGIAGALKVRSQAPAAAETHSRGKSPGLGE